MILNTISPALQGRANKSQGGTRPSCRCLLFLRRHYSCVQGALQIQQNRKLSFFRVFNIHNQALKKPSCLNSMILANFPYLEDFKFFFMLPKFYFRFQLVVQEIEGSSYIYIYNFSIVFYCQIWLKINVHQKQNKKKWLNFSSGLQLATLSTLQN